MKRHISEMTQEEADEMWKLLGWNERVTGPQRMYDLCIEFMMEPNDEFEPTAHWNDLLKILPYLVQQGFDLTPNK